MLVSKLASGFDPGNGLLMGKHERVLVARHSAFQVIRLTEDDSGLRTLRFGSDGPCQSIVRPGDPSHLAMYYARVVPAALVFAANLRRMLVVGLGGGSLPMFFHRHFPELSIEVVELDPEVLAVAREYCGFKEDNRLRVHLEDGRDFLESNREGFDVVILDCYDAQSTPPHLRTLEFLSTVRANLSVGGIAVANIWGRRYNPLFESMLLTYRAAFEEVYLFDVPATGSRIFAALPRKEAFTREELIPKARELSRAHRFPFDLADSITGFRNAELETVRGGAPLRDPK